MLEEGYIKAFRQFKRWQHYQEPTVVLVWLDILLSVNTQDAWWRGRKIRRGELFTSVEAIHQSTGLDPKTIRKALATLEESGEIKREATPSGTKIIVKQFNKFQDWGKIPQPTPQPTPHQQEDENINKLIIQERQTDDNARAKSSVVVGLVDFLSNWWDVNLTPAQVALIDSKPADYWESFKDEIEQSQWLRTKPIEMVLSLHANVVEGKYRTASKNAPFSSQGRQPSSSIDPHDTMRIAWDALNEQEQQEYLDTHGGKLPWEQ